MVFGLQIEGISYANILNVTYVKSEEMTQSKLRSIDSDRQNWSKNSRKRLHNKVLQINIEM